MTHPTHPTLHPMYSSDPEPEEWDDESDLDIRNEVDIDLTSVDGEEPI